MFDQTKSLEELEGQVWPYNDFGSQVVQESNLSGYGRYCNTSMKHFLCHTMTQFHASQGTNRF
jgi:hypothetical protein